jgi:hypothetical protein
MSDPKERQKPTHPPQQIPKKANVPQKEKRDRVTDSAHRTIKETPAPVNEKFKKVDE